MLQGLNPGRRPALGGEGPSASLRAYYCVLGHLYAAARLELMQMAATLQMEAHLTTSHMRQHVSSSNMTWPGIYELHNCCHAILGSSLMARIWLCRGVDKLCLRILESGVRLQANSCWQA